MNRLVLPLFAALVGCQPSGASRAPADSATLAARTATLAAAASTRDSAAAALAGFLAGSLETAARPDYERFYACTPDGQNNYSLALARYRVLDIRPDTGGLLRARAVVTSVATESDSATAGREWHVVVGVQEDTLTWQMARDSVTGRWGVCGYALNGAGFGHWGDDASSRWTPTDMSWARVRKLADSVQRAQP